MPVARLSIINLILLRKMKHLLLKRKRNKKKRKSWLRRPRFLLKVLRVLKKQKTKKSQKKRRKKENKKLNKLLNKKKPLLLR
jgi:hypothetical protein